VFWENQTVESYQKAARVIKKMGLGNEDFAKLLIGLVAGRIEFLLDIEDLAL
jgi:hypothetical protein